MKRKSLVAAALMLTITFSGCSDKVKTDDASVTVIPETTITATKPTEPEVITTPEVSGEPNTDPTENPTQIPDSTAYEVTFETFEVSENKKAIYPVISSWSLEDKSKEWNDRFSKAAQTIGDGLSEGDASESEFEVTQQTLEILSMIEKCYLNFDGAFHPQLACGSITIDMTNGNSLQLKDIADVNEVADVLISGKGLAISCEGCTMQDIWDFNCGGTVPEKDKLIEALTHFDEDYEENSNYVIYGNSFMKDGKVVLILSVSHVFGDYVFVELQK